MSEALDSRSFIALATVALLVASPVFADEQVPGALTLEGALELARENNEDIAIMVEHVEQAKALRIQVLSGMLPWITASASIGLTDEVIMDTGTESRVIVPGTNWGWGGSISLKIVDPSLYPALVASGKGVGASEMLLDHGISMYMYYTAQAYITTVFSQAAVKVRERELQTWEMNLEEVKARVEVDDALLLDQSRAELQVLQSKQAVETSRVEAILALDALCQLMGQSPGTEYVLAPVDASSLAVPTAAPTQTEVETQIADALDEERSDLEAMDLLLEASKAQKLSAWFGLLPTLSVSASYDQGPESFRSPSGVTWMVSFNMSWVLFDGGYTVGKIKENNSKALEALHDLEKAEKQVEGEVRSAWLLFDLAITNRDTAIKALEVAEKMWEMAHEKYAAGLASGLEVEAALDDLAQAEMGLLGQEMNLQLAWMEYLRASGQFEEVFGIQ